MHFFIADNADHSLTGTQGVLGVTPEKGGRFFYWGESPARRWLSLRSWRTAVFPCALARAAALLEQATANQHGRDIQKPQSGGFVYSPGLPIAPCWLQMGGGGGSVLAPRRRLCRWKTLAGRSMTVDGEDRQADALMALAPTESCTSFIFQPVENFRKLPAPGCRWRDTKARIVDESMTESLAVKFDGLLCVGRPAAVSWRIRSKQQNMFVTGWNLTGDSFHPGTRTGFSLRFARSDDMHHLCRLQHCRPGSEACASAPC